MCKDHISQFPLQPDSLCDQTPAKQRFKVWKQIVGMVATGSSSQEAQWGCSVLPWELLQGLLNPHSSVGGAEWQAVAAVGLHKMLGLSAGCFTHRLGNIQTWLPTLLEIPKATLHFVITPFLLKWNGVYHNMMCDTCYVRGKPQAP